jgi:FixJ family two-component response regulator
MQIAETFAPFAQMSNVQASAFTFHFPKQREASTIKKGQVIYLVDDDVRVREALAELLTSLGREVVSFGSAKEFLRYNRNDSSACLIVDVVLPDMSGLDLQKQLDGGLHPPIIFMSAHPDIPTTVRAMKAGAIEFLTKPVKPQDLITAIDTALAQDLLLRERRLELAKIHRGYSLLTPREREVLPLITGGMLNKQAAAYLGISEVTLQVHRGQVMRKMAARSFAELVRMAEKLGISTIA